MSLALRMGRTVRELLNSLDAAELNEWAAFYELDPWTEDRADMRAAQICSVVAQVQGAKVKPSDFMPTYGESEPVERSDEDLQLLAIRANAAMGGRVDTGG